MLVGLSPARVTRLLQQMKTDTMFELAFLGETMERDYWDVPLYATFRKGDTCTEVHGFYDGEGRYVIRFLPKEEGVYDYEVRGLFQKKGQIKVERNPDSKFIRAVGTHFEDGAQRPFFPFGTTVYGLVHQEESLIDKTFKTLGESPFNKIRFCVFPKHYDYNHNEPPYYPFLKKDPTQPIKNNHDASSPNLEFWHHFEKCLLRLLDLGIQADVILFHPYDRWGLNELSQEDNFKYLDYALARLSAFPHLWWSIANEYDLCLKRKSVEDFYRMEQFIASRDPFHHLLSCHNCFHPYDFSRPAITHVSLQTKDLSSVHHLLSDFNKPVVIDECCYEGDISAFWGSISPEEMTYRFARCLASGAYCTHGETYESDDEVLWWSKGGELKGESPLRIRFLKDLMKEIGSPLLPIPSFLVSFADMDKQERGKALESVPEEFRHYPKGIFLMGKDEARRFFDSEYEYQSKTEDGRVYFTFLDQRTCRELDMDLPSNRVYRVELLDLYAMKRTTLSENVSGRTHLCFEPKIGQAILATEIKNHKGENHD